MWIADRKEEKGKKWAAKDNHHQINILRQIKKTCVAFNITTASIKEEGKETGVTCVLMSFMTFYCTCRMKINKVTHRVENGKQHEWTEFSIETVYKWN